MCCKQLKKCKQNMNNSQKWSVIIQIISGYWYSMNFWLCKALACLGKYGFNSRGSTQTYCRIQIILIKHPSQYDCRTENKCPLQYLDLNDGNSLVCNLERARLRNIGHEVIWNVVHGGITKMSLSLLDFPGGDTVLWLPPGRDFTKYFL